MPFDYEAIEEDVQYELDEIERKEAVIHSLDGRIKQIYQRLDPDRTLKQLRGVSTTIASAVEALVGNVERFSNSKKFVSYCGLCPRKKRSGMGDPSMPITKSGQRLLKKYLYLAADVARQWADKRSKLGFLADCPDESRTGRHVGGEVAAAGAASGRVSSP